MSNKSCAVHMSGRMVTHTREIQQGVTGTFDPAISLEGSVNYTTLILMNSKNHHYSSLSSLFFSTLYFLLSWL